MRGKRFRPAGVPIEVPRAGRLLRSKLGFGLRELWMSAAVLAARKSG